nr:hypothetical protein B0A51_00908 [Rachicladosporium sp. CCFEE 5018]
MEDQNVEVAQPFLKKTVDSPSFRPNNFRRIILWFLGLASAIIMVGLLVVSYRAAANHESGCRAGELRTPACRQVIQTFTGGLRYDDEGHLYRNTNGEHRSYTGNSSEVDAAWRVFDAS